MYTSYIGKKFLNFYRQKKNLPKNYKAKQFFDEVLFPLFFNEREHLMHVGNSPFFQRPTAKAVEKTGSKPLAQLQKLHTDIAKEPPNMAIFVGYAAKDSKGTTSGQITSMSVTIDSEEMYASWVGQGLGIGVSGGFVILIDQIKVLWSIYEGWSTYRKYLKQTPNLKDKQIETWNGHWINHVYGKSYTVEIDPKPEMVLGKLAIPTLDWVKIIFSLSREYPNGSLIIYAYNLSQTNTTLGFINLMLPKVKKLVQLKNKLYGSSLERGSEKNFEQLYSTFYTFKEACKLGIIGLKALEPNKLRKFMPVGSVDYAGGRDFQIKNEEDYFQFKIFKIWILAMLSTKKEIGALAEQVAQVLINYEDKNNRSETGRGKSVQIRFIEEVKSSKTLLGFIGKLTEIMKIYPEEAKVFKTVKDTILELPSDLFPLFIALIRFEYQYKKSINS